MHFLKNSIPLNHAEGICFLPKIENFHATCAYLRNQIQIQMKNWFLKQLNLYCNSLKDRALLFDFHLNLSNWQKESSPNQNSAMDRIPYYSSYFGLKAQVPYIFRAFLLSLFLANCSGFERSEKEKIRRQNCKG